MKKFIYSIAALAAIVVMGSCSQDSDLTETSISKSKIDSVTISLNINSGISVTENDASMSKSSIKTANMLSTRAGSTNAQGNFTATLPEKYTAYFVAGEATSEFAKGSIVQKKTVTAGANDITVPAIKCNIYVTNYEPSTALSIDTTKDQETAIQGLEDALPMSSTTLYLFGATSGVDFSATNASATVTLTNHYAAVCVKNNGNGTYNYVNGVTFNYEEDHTLLDEVSAYDLTNDDTKTWYYMYIKTPDANNKDLANTSAKSNSTITLNKDKFTTIFQNGTWPLDNPITADNIYQYTVNPTNGGQGATLNVSVNAFQGTPNEGTLNPY